MADFAKLTVEIDSRGIPRTRNELGRFTKGATNAETATTKLTKSWSSFTKLIVAGGVAIGMRFLVKSIEDGQRAFAQLAIGLKSTGAVSGQTMKSLVALGEEMQRTTVFADDVVQSAEAILLSFTNIAGEAFPRTVRAAADVATRMGTDLRSAVVQLGKALNDPIQNLGALSRSGIQFSKDQKKVIKELVETNRLADAQTIILNELEKQYGGSARAARETLGGAITNLKNSFSDFGEAAGRFLGPLIEQTAKVSAGAIDLLTKKINEAADDLAKLIGTYEVTLKGMAEAQSAALEAVSRTTGVAEDDILALVDANKELALAAGASQEATEKFNEAQKRSVDAVAKILSQLGEQTATLGMSAEAEARYRVALAGGNEELQNRAAQWARVGEQKAAQVAVEDMIVALHEESLSLRLSTDQMELRAARLAGATPAQLEQIRIIRDTTNAQRVKTAADAEAERLVSSLRTQEERINEQRERALQLFKQGALSVAEYGTAISRLNDRMAELGAKTEETGDTISTTLPTLGSEMESLALTFGTSFIDTLFDAERRAELTFESVASGFAKMVARMLAQQALLSALGMPSIFSPATAAAKGAAFSAGRVTPMARGGVVTQPTLFPMARGAGLMGEAGPEAVMPLTRTSSGELGVKAEGGGEVVVNVINNTGARVTQQRRQSGQRTEIDVIVGDAVNRQIKEGALDRSLQSSFGLHRRSAR